MDAMRNLLRAALCDRSSSDIPQMTWLQNIRMLTIPESFLLRADEVIE